MDNQHPRGQSGQAQLKSPGGPKLLKVHRQLLYHRVDKRATKRSHEAKPEQEVRVVQNLC